jgi:hypothetical protein
MKAFPTEHPLPGYMDLMSDGMDLRDYFAAKAMQGLLTQGESYLDLKAASYQKDAFWQYVAEMSYTIANEMMEARK